MVWASVEAGSLDGDLSFAAFCAGYINFTNCPDLQLKYFALVFGIPAR